MRNEYAANEALAQTAAMGLHRPTIARAHRQPVQRKTRGFWARLFGL